MFRIFRNPGCHILAITALWLLAGTAAAQEVAAIAGADGVQHIAIVGSSHFFRPSHAVARASQPLEIAWSVEPGLVPHRFVLEGPDGQRLADMAMGTQEQTLRLTVPAGSYRFYCATRLLLLPSHCERGMAGVLQVQE